MRFDFKFVQVQGYGFKLRLDLCFYLQENSKYKTFRNKGIPPDIGDLWDQIFTNIVATGKHCVAAGMDVEEPDGQDDIVQLEDDDNDEFEYEDDGRFANLTPLNLDGHDDDILREVYQKVTQTEGNTSAAMRPPKAKSKVTKGSTQSLPNAHKRKSKPSAGSVLYNEGLAMIGQTSERMLTLLERDVASSTGCPTKKTFTLDDGMEVIEGMVQEGSLVEGEKLWCFVVDQLMVEETRNAFMTIPRDPARFSWLKWRFDKFGN